MRASISDLSDCVHIAFEGDDLSDAELMGDEDSIFALFKLLVEFHHGTESHEFECLPGRSKAVVGILQMMAVDYGIAFEVGRVYLEFEVAGVGPVDNGTAYEPDRIGFVFVGEMVNERSAEGYLDAVEITHKQKPQVKIEIVQVDSVFERSAFDIFVGAVAKLRIRLLKGK